MPPSISIDALRLAVRPMLLSTASGSGLICVPLLPQNFWLGIDHVDPLKNKKDKKEEMMSQNIQVMVHSERPAVYVFDPHIYGNISGIGYDDLKSTSKIYWIIELKNNIHTKIYVKVKNILLLKSTDQYLESPEQ
jgi:hypothetical protein